MIDYLASLPIWVVFPIFLFFILGTVAIGLIVDWRMSKTRYLEEKEKDPEGS